VALSRLEMILPSVNAGMEQRHDRLGVWVDARQIGPFVSVASITGKRQARGIAGAAVLLRHDMFRWKGMRGVAD